MSLNHSETWRKNIQGKINEVIDASRLLLVSEVPEGAQAKPYRNELLSNLTNKIDNLKAFYTKGLIPYEVEQIRTAAKAFSRSREASAAFSQLINAIRALDEMPLEDSKFVSFSEIFEDYKNDSELDALVNDLIATLQRVVDEDITELNGRITKDLEKLLKQLKSEKKHSVIEIQMVVEIIGKFALENWGNHYGIKGAGLLVDIAKICNSVKNRVMEKVRNSENNFITLIDIKSTPPNIETFPELSDDSLKNIAHSEYLSIEEPKK